MNKKKADNVIERLVAEEIFSKRGNNDIKWSKEFQKCILKGKKLLNNELNKPIILKQSSKGWETKSDEQVLDSLLAPLFSWLYMSFRNNEDPLDTSKPKTIWDKNYEQEVADATTIIVAFHKTIREEKK